MGRGNYKKKRAHVEVQEVKKMDEFFEEVLHVETTTSQIQEAFIEVPAPLFKVKVTHSSLRRRQGPDFGAEVLGLITDKGIYEIFNVKDDWGRLNDGSWIKLEFTKKISE